MGAFPRELRSVKSTHLREIPRRKILLFATMENPGALGSRFKLWFLHQVWLLLCLLFVVIFIPHWFFRGNWPGLKECWKKWYLFWRCKMKCFKFSVMWHKNIYHLDSNTRHLFDAKKPWSLTLQGRKRHWKMMGTGKWSGGCWVWVTFQRQIVEFSGGAGLLEWLLSPRFNASQAEAFEQWSFSAPGGLGRTDVYRDCTTQLCGDYNEPLQGSLLSNQHHGKYIKSCFFWGGAHCWQVLQGPDVRRQKLPP